MRDSYRELAPTVSLIGLYLLSSCAALTPTVPGDARQFLLLAKRLADSDRLYDPDYVKLLLHTMLTVTFDNEPDDFCKKYPNLSFGRITSYAARSNSWFRRSPKGTDIYIRVGPDIFNPNTKEGEVKIDEPAMLYELTKRVRCDPAVQKPEYAGVRFTFYNVPGFVCVSPALIDDIFPDRFTEIMMDGKPPTAYRGKSATLEFDIEDGDFRIGKNGPVRHQPACLLTMRIGGTTRRADQSP